MENKLKLYKEALLHASIEFFRYIDQRRQSDFNESFFEYLESKKDELKFKFTRVHNVSFEVNFKPYVIKSRIVYKGDKIDRIKIFESIIENITEENANHFYLYSFSELKYFIASEYTKVDNSKVVYMMRYAKDYGEVNV